MTDRRPKRGETLPAVAILSRAPQAGRSKTRLAAEIGAAAAAHLAEAMLRDTAQALGRSGQWRTVLFVEPASAVASMATLSEIGDVRPQGPGSIGARMRAAAETLLADGFGPIILVGSDIPTLGPGHVEAAIVALQHHDAVFGPAGDGGYYLLGLWEAVPELFDDATIPWSTSAVLAASERAASRRGWRSARIRGEQDIDTPADLATLRKHLAGGPRESQDARRIGAHTAAVVRSLGSAIERVAPVGLRGSDGAAVE